MLGGDKEERGRRENKMGRAEEGIL